MIFYKKNINEKESINNFTCFKCYSLNENFSLIICQTSLNVTYKIYNQRFIKLLSHWVKRIKNKLEKPKKEITKTSKSIIVDLRKEYEEVKEIIDLLDGKRKL